MPLYEYQCDACGHRFERIQKFSDPPVEACPDCGGAVRKLISSPAIQFKGSGWYITDYARKGGDGDGKKPDAPAAKPDDSSSKPAAGEAKDKSEKKDAPAKTESSSTGTTTKKDTSSKPA